MSESSNPRVALVTGGSRGIGLAITQRLLAGGFVVAVLATKPEPDHFATQVGGDALYVQGSVAEPNDHDRFIAAAMQRWGRIDVLVNNAGVAPQERADVLDMSAASFDRVLAINLRGPFLLTQRVAQKMIAIRDAHAHDRNSTSSELSKVPRTVGTIINVSSVSATVVSTNRGEYCVSKAGVSMATQVFAARLAPEGIGVHEIRPGVIATDMTAGVKDRYDTLFATGLAPIPRWGTPADVAEAVHFLAEGRLSYSAGEVLHVDGGLHIPRL